MANPEPIGKREIRISLGVIALTVAVLIVSSFLLTTLYWFVWPIIVVCTLVAVSYVTASKHFYQCPCCKKEFKITAMEDFFAPHGISKAQNGKLLEWKLLKCLQCDKRQRCYRV
jgi:hypothetical protein